MPYQAKAKTTAKVQVTCEKCGKTYAYEHYFYAYGRQIDEQYAVALARENMDKVFAHYSKQIAAEDFSSVVENKPCPDCGSLQSWMVDSLIGKKSWKVGLIWASIVFVLMIPVSFILRVFVSDQIMSLVSFFLIFILPIFVLIYTRNNQIKKLRETKVLLGKINKPNVEMFKGLLPETHWTL